MDRITSIPVEFAPYDMVVNSTGDRLYVSNYAENSVSEIDTRTNTVVHTMPVGVNPCKITLGTSDQFLYVANQDSNNVTALDI